MIIKDSQLAGALFWLLFMLPISMHGKSGDGDVPWKIDELVQQAFLSNAELRFYEAEIEAAKGQRRQSGLWKNPEFSGEYGSRRVTDSDENLQGDGFTRSVSVSQTFEFPGKGTLRKAIADKNVELAEYGLRQFRLALEGRVKLLTIQYSLAMRNATVAEGVCERSEALIKLLKERAVSGVQQFLELRTIEGGLIEQHQLVKEWTQVRDETRIELNALLGWPANQPLRVQVDESEPKTKAMDFNAFVLTGLERNLQLHMRRLELEKAMREVSAAKLDVAPDFSVGPFFSQDKAGDLEENFGGAISMTLPLWNWNQGNIATAKARKLQADAMLLEARRKVEAEICRRLRAQESNTHFLQRIPEKAVADLRDAYDMAERQYRLGAIGLPLYTEVQKEFLSILKTRSESVIEAWRHRLDLELLLGGATPVASPLPSDRKEVK